MKNLHHSLKIHPTTRMSGDVIFDAPFLLHSGCLVTDFHGGAFSYMSPGCFLAKTLVGRYCSIGNGVSIISKQDTNWTQEGTFQGLLPRPLRARYRRQQRRAYRARADA